MDIKQFDKPTDLKQNLMNFCIGSISKTKAEIELDIKFEYSNNFVDFIVEKAFTSAQKIEDIPVIMQALITERKKHLVDSREGTEIIVQKKVDDSAFVIDYHEKQGTLLRINNRTLNRYFEKDAVNNIVNQLRLEKKKQYIRTPENDALVEAASWGDLEFIEDQFKQGGLTFHVFNNHMIDAAAKHNQLEVVEYLVERGARVQRAILYGNEKIKDWAYQWKKNHPEKLKNFDISWKDYLAMMENNPDWIKDVSYEKVSELQEINPGATLEEKRNQVIYSIAILRNTAGQDAVEQFKSKIIKNK